MAKDYYKILGIARSADQKEVKKAYRKLARSHHPDINPNDKAAESRFKEINEAYQVLSDTEKRGLYDQFGADYDKVQTGGPTGPNVPPGGFDFSEVFNRGGAGRAGAQPAEGMDPRVVGDLFENIFGGFKGGRGAPGAGKGGFNFGGMHGPQKGQDVEVELEISLGESIEGTLRNLQLKIQDPATGRQEQRSVSVRIPAGVGEGSRVRAAQKGATGSNGGAPGDMFLRIHIQPHPFWTRHGQDLHCEVPVTFSEAALGATIAVPTINGDLQLKIPPGTQNGQIFRLSNRGLPNHKDGGAGSEFVKIKVAVPKALSPREEELISELARLREQDVRKNLASSL